MLNHDMKDHHRVSHRCSDTDCDYTSDFRIFVITYADYSKISRVTQGLGNAAFWRVLRGLPSLKPLVSGLRGGENSFLKSEGVSFLIPKGRILSKEQKKRTSQTTAEQVTQPTRLELLEGFVNIVGEQVGYKLAIRAHREEMGEKTEKEAKAVREASTALGKSMDALIETPTEDFAHEVLANQKALKAAKETAKKVRKPFMEKITPLAKAVKYIENVAVPDSLKELGQPVVPVFKLSDWVEKALESTKKK